MNTNSGIRWNEQDSATFIDTSSIFVPGRSEQTETLLQLVPAQRDEHFTIVELASGEGILAEALLEAFPNCHYLALDGSEVMRKHLSKKLARFNARLEVRSFEIADREWRTTLPQATRCIVSSLCVHHLSDEGKRQLFQDMAQQLEPNGALLLADIVRPANARIAALFAHQYDEIVRAQSLQQRGDLSGFTAFQEEQWNYFQYDYNDPTSYDLPSSLPAQLQWLQEAGFKIADCFWMQAGHAVYGGFI
ncbi:class I SAM-dependent methyltransferase [Dictyobacter arantiisoli]|uniref:Methyltransferase domain-containing protein n=1 Tax=Dictyobacter arantiisoli TaxID=2014874 RepID=A0A5A5TBW7_9CHLR|nr:class I SAM-dependent methyltransferase [Dictyobacter arantiisoli]GCF08424.1 hypothetical protein KDI_19880 [Dictyobacter arantiisoli]